MSPRLPPDVAMAGRLRSLAGLHKSAAARRLPLPPKRACFRCGVEYQLTVKQRNSNRRFCSKRCAFMVRVDAGHNQAVSRATAKRRGDAMRGRGEGKTYRKYMGRHEHRVVAERALGRPLMPGEIVHHDDEDILNNDPSNLRVLASRAEHSRIHALQRHKK